MNQRPNFIRAGILSELHQQLVIYRTSAGEDSFNAINEAHRLNDEYMERSRGKGRNLPFIKSVAGKRGNCTFFPVSKRGGAKECERRVPRKNAIIF